MTVKAVRPVFAGRVIAVNVETVTLPMTSPSTLRSFVTRAAPPSPRSIRATRSACCTSTGTRSAAGCGSCRRESSTAARMRWSARGASSKRRPVWSPHSGGRWAVWSAHRASSRKSYICIWRPGWSSAARSPRPARFSRSPGCRSSKRRGAPWPGRSTMARRSPASGALRRSSPRTDCDLPHIPRRPPIKLTHRMPMPSRHGRRIRGDP